MGIIPRCSRDLEARCAQHTPRAHSPKVCTAHSPYRLMCRQFPFQAWHASRQATEQSAHSTRSVGAVHTPSAWALAGALPQDAPTTHCQHAGGSRPMHRPQIPRLMGAMLLLGPDPLTAPRPPFPPSLPAPPHLLRPAHLMTSSVTRPPPLRITSASPCLSPRKCSGSSLQSGNSVGRQAQVGGIHAERAACAGRLAVLGCSGRAASIGLPMQYVGPSSAFCWRHQGCQGLDSWLSRGRQLSRRGGMAGPERPTRWRLPSVSRLLSMQVTTATLRLTPSGMSCMCCPLRMYALLAANTSSKTEAATEVGAVGMGAAGPAAVPADILAVVFQVENRVRVAQVVVWDGQLRTAAQQQVL